MTPLAYFRAVTEIQQADLSPEARELALSGVNQGRYQRGRRHQLLCAYVGERIRSGRSLSYATSTAASIYGLILEEGVKMIKQYEIGGGVTVTFSGSAPEEGFAAPIKCKWSPRMPAQLTDQQRQAYENATMSFLEEIHMPPAIVIDTLEVA